MTHALKTPCEEVPVQAKPVPVDCEPELGRWVLAATIHGSSMAFIDGTVVNVALPVIQSALGATGTEMQWVVQAYALFLAALILVGGSMGDHLGRRKVFVWGVVTFAAASIWCSLVLDVNQLIIAQAVKGIGGAMLIPGSLAIISATFSQRQRGRAIGTWSGATAITTALGPVLGGWLAENVSWRAVFFINVPLAVVVLVLALWRVPESRDDEVSGTALDWGGALLATLGIGGIVYGLTAFGRLETSRLLASGSIGVGALVFLLFLGLEARLKTPMMPLKVFRSATFSGANLLTLMLYSALGGVLFYFPFNLIQVQGYSPTAAGAALLPFVVILSLLSRWSGGLVERYGAKRPLIIGPLIVAAGFALFARPEIGGSYWTTFFPAIFILGCGMALSVAPLTTAVMNSVSSHQSGVASGVNNAVSRAANLFGIAAMGIVMSLAFNSHLDQQLAPLDLSAETAQVVTEQRANLAGATIPDTVGPERQMALRRAFDESFVAGFRLVMLVGAGLAVISALCAWGMIEGKQNEV